MAIPKDKVRMQFSLDKETVANFDTLFVLERDFGEKEVRYGSDLIKKLIHEEYERRQSGILTLLEIKRLQEEIYKGEKDKKDK